MSRTASGQLSPGNRIVPKFSEPPDFDIKPVETRRLPTTGTDERRAERMAGTKRGGRPSAIIGSGAQYYDSRRKSKESNPIMVLDDATPTSLRRPEDSHHLGSPRLPLEKVHGAAEPHITRVAPQTKNISLANMDLPPRQLQGYSIIGNRLALKTVDLGSE